MLNGRIGTAKTKMLPSGMVTIDGRAYDAVSNGFAIEPGDPIQVIEIRANRVVVRRVDPSEQATTGDADDVLSQPIDQFGLDPIDEG